jgi:hypothetical protein
VPAAASEGVDEPSVPARISVVLQIRSRHRRVVENCRLVDGPIDGACLEPHDVGDGLSFELGPSRGGCKVSTPPWDANSGPKSRSSYSLRTVGKSTPGTFGKTPRASSSETSVPLTLG